MTENEAYDLCITILTEALVNFGSYAYGDKGPTEIIDFRHLCNKFVGLDGKNMVNLFIKLLNTPPIAPWNVDIKEFVRYLINNTKFNKDSYDKYIESNPAFNYINE
jgi:hypothetical protein